MFLIFFLFLTKQKELYKNSSLDLLFF